MFEIIGIITVSIIGIIIINKVYRYYNPKVYTYENCPGDHDTQSRYGARKCSICNTTLNDY